MKKALTILVICFTLLLAACGGSEGAAPAETEILENGQVVSRYYEEGGVVREVMEFPDGGLDETRIDAEGKLLSNQYTSPDGMVIQCEFYPSGNFKIMITRNPDGSYTEEHFLDDGVVDLEQGTITAGTVYYRKTVSADGTQREEYIEPEEKKLEADGTYWVEDKMDNGSSYRARYSQENIIIESIWENPELGIREETQYNEQGIPVFSVQEDSDGGRRIEREYYPSGEIWKMTTTYADSNEQSYMEYYESGSIQYEYSLLPNGDTQEAKYNEQGYYTYMGVFSSQGDWEYFADENGKLLKFVENGKVYEGNQIPGHEQENFRLMQENTQFQPETEE